MKDNFCYFLFASLRNKTLPEQDLLLILLNSEQPKLYGVLAVLSAKGFSREIASRSKHFPVRGDNFCKDFVIQGSRIELTEVALFYNQSPAGDGGLGINRGKK